MSSAYLPQNSAFFNSAAAVRDAKLPIFSQMGLGAFLLGVASSVPVRGVGLLFVGEVLLMAIAPLVVLLLYGLGDQYGKTARLMLNAIIVSWVGYVIADIVQGTPTNDYIRGWARWIATGASFATLAWIGSKNVRFVAIFLLGMAVGACIVPFIAGVGVGLESPKRFWKFTASAPVCIIATIVASRFRPWVSVAALLGLAGLSIVMDTRSVALMCVLAAGISWLAARRTVAVRGTYVPVVRKNSMFVAGTVMLGVLVGSVYMIKSIGEHYGFSQRFDKSNSTRLASATVAWSAVRRSPIIGHGSWPRDPAKANERDKLVTKLKGQRAYRMDSQKDLIIAHSQILQGWLEGGILGLTFFVLLAWQLGRQLLWQVFVSPFTAMTPLIAFIQLQCAWHLVFSPFSGAQRVFIPAACVFICYISQKMRELKSEQDVPRALFAVPQYRPAIQG